MKCFNSQLKYNTNIFFSVVKHVIPGVSCHILPLVINMFVLRHQYNYKNELDHHPKEKQRPLGKIVQTISSVFTVTGSSRAYMICLNLKGNRTSNTTWGGQRLIVSICLC